MKKNGGCYGLPFFYSYGDFIQSFCVGEVDCKKVIANGKTLLKNENRRRIRVNGGAGFKTHYSFSAHAETV